jgi:NADH-ubiquinone oxidoreductase chain 5
MYLTILILPLLASIIAGFFGRKIGVTGSQLISCGCVVLTTLLCVLTFIEVGISNIPVHIQLFR